MKYRKAGYLYLLDYLNLEGLDNWHTSFVSFDNTRSTEKKLNLVKVVYPSGYWPGDGIFDHLEFALKYDGVNLSLLYLIFERIPCDKIVEYIRSKPTSKYARRIWFFYEFLNNIKLPINDVLLGNYVDALETDKYYTIANSKNSKRHRVVNNLLGSRHFCPIVRKTKNLLQLDSEDLKKKLKNVVSNYPPKLISRALNYFYNKETKSSFEIENLKPDASRKRKFILSLGLAEKEDFCKKDRLIELQNLIVDPRFKDKDYRTTQSYIGETISHLKEKIHFICPKPCDLKELMSGLIKSHNIIKDGGLSEVIHTAVVSYGFVFLHPFEDGNGRMHRFLIHNVLSTRSLTPQGLMFPVSAVMLKNLPLYDASLEAFSKPLLNLIDYQIDDMGIMTVKNKTEHLYRYIDMTYQAEFLYDCINKTIEQELIEELKFLANYDRSKKAIQKIVDMPGRLIDLFIRLYLEDKNKLLKYRNTSFNFLTDTEFDKISLAIRNCYNTTK